jgi:hypothetical protein
MYAPAQIGLATLLGGPLAGGRLMTLNYRRMGQPRSARLTLALAVLSTVAIIAIWSGVRAASGEWRRRGRGQRADCAVRKALCVFLRSSGNRGDPSIAVPMSSRWANRWRVLRIHVVEEVLDRVVLVVSGFAARKVERRDHLHGCRPADVDGTRR